MVKVIVFDFAGVVVSRVLLDWLNKNIPDERKRKEYFKEITEKNDLGLINLNELFKLISEKTNVPPDKVWNTIYSTVIVNRELIEIIEKLKRKYKTAIFSDNLYEVVDKILKTKNLSHYFDKVIVSSQYKMKKTNPLLYKKMLEILDVNIDELIFVDDAQENINVAKKLGIKSILFTTNEKLLDELISAGIKV